VQHVAAGKKAMIVAHVNGRFSFFRVEAKQLVDKTADFPGLSQASSVVALADPTSSTIVVCALAMHVVTCSAIGGKSKVVSSSATSLVGVSAGGTSYTVWLEDSAGASVIFASANELCASPVGSVNRSGAASLAQQEGKSVFIVHETAQVLVTSAVGPLSLAKSDRDGATVFQAAFVMSPAAPGELMLRILSQSDSSILSAFTVSVPTNSSGTCTLDLTSQVKQGTAKYSWSRDESLASIAAIVAVAAPADLIVEHSGEASDISHGANGLSFLARLGLQWGYVSSALQTSADLAVAAVSSNLLGTKPRTSTHAAVEQMGVVLCHGRGGVSIVHGLDLHSGRVRWTMPFRSQVSLQKGDQLLVVKETSTHAAEPQVALVRQLHTTSVVSWIGAWSGELLLNEQVAFSASHSVAVDAGSTASGMGAIALLGGVAGVSMGTVVPAAARNVSPADAFADVVLTSYQKQFNTSSFIQGQVLRKSGDSAGNPAFEVLPVWSTSLAASPWEAAVGTTSSQLQAGVPLGDDSLLVKFPSYKLLPVLSCTEAGVSARIVDSQTGRLLHSQFYEGRCGPLSTAQNDHTVYFSMWDTKSAQAELHAVSLFAGAVGKSELGPWPWQASARKATPLQHGARSDPSVIKTASFVLPRAAVHLHMSSTKNGLAQRFLLISTASGDVWAVSDRIVDPRRPKKDLSSFDKASGLVQYDATVPLQHHTSVFKTYTAAGARILASFPCSMESCATVITAGLDLAGCELWQTRPFDQLPSDFNSGLLLLLMSVLAVATWFLKSRLASQQLSSSWQ